MGKATWSGNPDHWVPIRKGATGSSATVVAMGGDGIGPEIVSATVKCISAMGLPIEFHEPMHGRAAVEAGGNALPDSVKETIQNSSAVLFGAIDTVSGHSGPILRYLRFHCDAYANLRPACSIEPLRGVIGKEGCNLVIVRELSEGEYLGREGDLAEWGPKLKGFIDPIGRPLPESGKFAVRVITEKASDRVARVAARLATQRREQGVGSGKITIVGKTNVLKQSDGFFEEVARAAISDVDSSLNVDFLFVDEACRRLVVMPETFDVILTTNLYGDIMSDVASEIIGGIAVAPSASIGESTAYFESCHGSAPDIAGQGIANPTATLLSGAMMLTYLGFQEGAQRLAKATYRAIGGGTRTRDLGGSATTSEFTDAVLRELG